MFTLLLAADALALAVFLIMSRAAVLRLAVASLAALTLVAGPAYADTSVLADIAGAVVWPILVPIVSSVVGIALVMAGRVLWGGVSRGLDLLEEKTGIEVDAAHRAALHSALDTGLHLAVQRGAPVIQDAVAAWVRLSVPGAVKHFGLSDEMLDGLVDAKIRRASVATPLSLPGAILPGLADVAAVPLQLAGAA